LWYSTPSASFTVASDDTAESTADANDEDKRVENPAFKDSRSITLEHDKGERYQLPWLLCRQWKVRAVLSFQMHAKSSQNMKDLIKSTYEDNEEAKREIDKGEYKLTKHGAKILPQHWDALIEPWTFLRIQLDSQKDDEDKTIEKKAADGSSSPEENEDVDPVYETKVKYRLTTT
jgi:hypothetical protein